MRKLIALLLLPCIVQGCATVPNDAFKLQQSSLEIRQLQTRKFETKDEIELLSAGAAQLQDMGYLIEETEKDLGLIVASKDADATNGNQIAAMVAITILAGMTGGSASMGPIDKTQNIRVSFVTIPAANKTGYIARITFQRIVWNDHGQISRVETISDPKIYQDFFSGLSKSVFLEANQL